MTAVRRAWLAVRLWVAVNIKWLWPFAAAVAQALRPWLVDGQHWTTQQWLSVLGFIAAAFLTGVVPNLEQGIAQYAKGITVVIVVGLSAAYNVAPGGFTRADVWTVVAAVLAALGTILTPTAQPQSVLASGPGFLGDTVVSSVVTATGTPTAAGGIVAKPFPMVLDDGERIQRPSTY